MPSLKMNPNRDASGADGEQHIIPDGLHWGNPFCFAVLGDKTHFQPDRVRRAFDCPDLPCSSIVPVLKGTTPNSDWASSVRPEPCRPANPEHLAFAQLEVDAFQDFV